MASRPLVPCAEWVLDLKVGDIAPDCFRGSRAIVDEIFARGVDVNGRPYVCGYLRHNLPEGAFRCSFDFKAGEPHITVIRGNGFDLDMDAAVEGRVTNA